MIMTDHPALLHTDAGAAYRAVAVADSAVLIKADSAEGTEAVDSDGSALRVDTVDPSVLSGPDDLVAPLKDAGVVVRVTER